MAYGELISCEREKMNIPHSGKVCGTIWLMGNLFHVSVKKMNIPHSGKVCGTVWQLSTNWSV